jgi:hypothetical protein
MPMLASLIVALALADPAGGVPAPASLDVPYLSQTEALCGGAAAAMVFRYWGDRHADVQQFASLVDRKAGGIADDVLVDAVRQRRWQTSRFIGSIEAIREHLLKGQPLILLLEDRPGRYHYVVAVGADADHVIVHDPVWGPSRRWSEGDLVRAWKPSNFWTLLVLPPQPSPDLAASAPALTVAKPDADLSAAPFCVRLMNEAVDEIGRRGTAVADAVIGAVREQCPADAAPIAELAGVRFAEHRWREAENLAEEAARRDPHHEYAWDVLGSSRFMQNDSYGALSAWNRIGKPRLDSIDIKGLTRTRYALVAEALALTPNSLLTPEQFRLAERRLQQLPSRLSARLELKPEADGYATVGVAIIERPAAPRGAFQWTSAAVQTAVDREARIAVPSGIGQGEMWDASWRWWAGRPKVSVAFNAPRVGWLPGVWRAEASWEAETYAGVVGTTREERTHGGLAIGNWLSGNLRYEITAGADSWDGRRAASIGGTLERRFFGDSIALSTSATAWMPFSEGGAFQSASASMAFRSSADASGYVQVVNAGIQYVSDRAPRTLWPGAGDGHARPTLLRGHSLLRGGTIDGPIFGRTVSSMSVETQRWFDRPALPRLGIAIFVDAAHAARRFTNVSAAAFQVDGGIGLRARLPGREGMLRLDYGHGIRDGANQLTIGWQSGVR